MASRGGPRAAGSDGSDFSHREQVASRYQASTALKAKLKVCAYVNLFVCLPVALFIINSHLGLVSLPDETGPHLSHYLLLATCLSSVLYLASLPRNKKLMVQLANVVVVGCGLGGAAWGLYSYFWILKPLLLKGEFRMILQSPMVLPLAWFIVFMIKILLYSQTLYYARQLMGTWDTKKTK
ncbi:protein jagunal homolog 1-like [Patiria miniata]|uniref:Uncharacterized protein n=1 Tax=Patiria miniata TaxID=46514 RepID=A0A914BN63_PATMI|nr:protein jagunal homolog 1-like [Patiria miniata]